MTTLRDLARHPAVHLAFAFFAMGGWAVYANRMHPVAQALTAGLVQGLLSVGITRVLQRLIEGFVARLRGRGKAWLPPMAAFALSLTLLSVIHRVSGTPEILATIALPLSVSTAYAIFFTRTLIREKGHDAT
jgi:ascorbate-specific PTS system EIIC-type component UlaA